MKLPEKKLDIKLIALDLDDTLLNNNREISDKNVEMLRRAAALGIYVVLCSGRAEDGILPFVRRLDIAGMEAGKYLIAINGASVFDLHKRLQVLAKKVPGETLLMANDEAEKIGLRSEVYTPDTIYYAEETQWTKIDVDLCKIKGEEVPNYEHFLTRGFSKMLIPGEPEKVQVLQQRLKEVLGDKAVVFTSKPFFLEIMPPECGKGEAIKWLAEYLHIPMEQTMCFGDGMNDESMIRMCGNGVAMKNACQYIQDAARYVTELDNNESGVGDFIQKYVL